MTADDNKDHRGPKSKITAYTVKVLNLLREAQLTQGLRHNDYQLYRQYCSRRIRRLRKSLGFGQGSRKNFRKREVNPSLLKDERYLFIPLMTVERYWAFAMQLKEESSVEHRKKFAMRNKLRKAASSVIALEKLVDGSNYCDARTQMEIQGYSAWLQGTVLFEMAEFTHEWETPVEFFNNAHAIYGKLRSTVVDDEVKAYEQRLQELEVKLRYCRHHLGDKAATDKLLAMRENEALGAKLDKLVATAREKQASTLSEVTWKGRILAVKHEKIRLFLLNESLTQEELSKASRLDNRVDRLDRLLMDAKDAIQITKEDLKNDSSFKPRQSANDGPVSSFHFLHTYLSYLRLNLTVLRNLALYHLYRAIINGDKKVKEGKKAPKIQDMVRLCDLIIQNLNEMTTLAGLEDDVELRRNVADNVVAYRALRCFYVAENFAKVEKWSEALALYNRTAELINETTNYELENVLSHSLVVLQEMIESKKYTAHAKVLLGDQSDAPDLALTSPDDNNKYLIDRLEVYNEDEGLLSKNPRVAPIPPEMVSVPCKPLFFDLALNHVEFPTLDDKVSTPDDASGKKPAHGAPASSMGGIRGLVKGLWGWGS